MPESNEQKRLRRAAKREASGIPPRFYFDTPENREGLLRLVNEQKVTTVRGIAQALSASEWNVRNLAARLTDEGLIKTGFGWVSTPEFSGIVYPASWDSINGKCPQGHPTDQFAVQRQWGGHKRWCCRECDRLDAAKRVGRRSGPMRGKIAADAALTRKEEFERQKKRAEDDAARHSYELLCGHRVIYRAPVMNHEDLWCERCEEWKPQAINYQRLSMPSLNKTSRREGHLSPSQRRRIGVARRFTSETSSSTLGALAPGSTSPRP